MGEWPWEAQCAAEGPDQAECPESGPPAPGRGGVGVRPGRSSSDDLWASSQGAAVRCAWGRQRGTMRGALFLKRRGLGWQGSFPTRSFTRSAASRTPGAVRWVGALSS